jgi:hypothetical protein
MLLRFFGFNPNSLAGYVLFALPCTRVVLFEFSKREPTFTLGGRHAKSQREDSATSRTNQEGFVRTGRLQALSRRLSR